MKKFEKKGVVKRAPKGFSWTTLLFGWFVPLIRGDIKWFAIMLICNLLTFGISHFVFPFFYNKNYTNQLKMEDFKEV